MAMTNDAVGRQDVRFPSDSGFCSAWLYLPVGATGGSPAPVVVMAHGLGGVRTQRLDAFAERFRDAGYACLVFDYRHFGESIGEPRELIDIDRQLADWAAAVSFARTLPQCNPERVVVWGTSFSGGHVTITAARDRRIAAAVAQCPFTDGPASALAIGIREGLRLGLLGVRDLLAARRGEAPVRVATAASPGGTALMTAPSAEAGLDALTRASGLEPSTTWVPARVGLRIVRHVPGRWAKKVRCPMLFAVSERDTVAPAAATVRWASTAPHSELRLYDADHFDIYIEPWFDRVVGDQIAFLLAHVPPHSA